MRKFCGKKFFAAYALLCALILSSCKSGSDVPSASVTSETVFSVSENEAVTVSSEGTSVSEKMTETDAESAADTSEKISETSDTDLLNESASEAVSDSDAEQSSQTSISGTNTAETAVTSPPITETVSSAAFETTAAKPAETAEIIIPDIKVPLASGTSVISEEKAELDHSNASDGYISVVYKGSSAQAKLRIANGSVQYDHDISADGTRDFIPLMGSGSYSVKVYEQVSGKNFAEILSGEFSVSMKNEADTFLYPNKYVSYGQSSECVKKAAEVCAGKSGDVEEIAAIFEYISDNITYDKQLAATVKSGYIPDPDKTLASGKGICFDYASLFAAMCRSRGIPARLVIGYAEPNIYHAWNEVYTEETGWITPELFLRKKGYNIADATFYSSNPDKQKIADYISDDGNYSAMYRY